MVRRVLRAALGLGVFDLHPPCAEPFADRLGALSVVFPGRVHGRDADQLRREAHQFVTRAIHLREEPDALPRHAKNRTLTGL